MKAKHPHKSQTPLREKQIARAKAAKASARAKPSNRVVAYLVGDNPIIEPSTMQRIKDENPDLNPDEIEYQTLRAIEGF